jgi:ribosomal protein S21
VSATRDAASVPVPDGDLERALRRLKRQAEATLATVRLRRRGPETRSQRRRRKRWLASRRHKRRLARRRRERGAARRRESSG